MRLYLDTNVYAHAQDAGQEIALRDWLTQACHRAVLSDVLLEEAIAIPDEDVRDGRLRLFADLPSVKTDSLGELQTREFLNEVRRLRSGWRRLPVGDVSTVDAMRRARQDGWRLLSKDPQRLVHRTGDYRGVTERGIRGARVGQRTIREDILATRTKVNEVILGSDRVQTRPLELDDEADFCRFEALLAWYQAVLEGAETLSEYRAYAEPYLRPDKIAPDEFATFWLDEVELERMPRGWATGLVTHAQLRSRIVHGNSADARHAGHVLDADLIVTEDERFHAALQTVAARVADAAHPRLLSRADPDLLAQLTAVVAP
jgi:hypothetical protein